MSNLSKQLRRAAEDPLITYYMSEQVLVSAADEIEEMEGALQKICTESGDARDCRYIAGQALAAAGKECEL